jgi:hypothetical protein
MKSYKYFLFSRLILQLSEITSIERLYKLLNQVLFRLNNQ